MTRVLVVIEHDRGTVAPAALEAMAFARTLGDDVVALTIGGSADPLAELLGRHGASEVHQAHHDLLADYNPEAWGDVVAGAVRFLAPAFVVATGTDVGNEVLANAAAVLDLPMAANCLAVESTEPFTVRRVRWGGSLIEHGDGGRAGSPAHGRASRGRRRARAPTPAAGRGEAVRRRARSDGRPLGGGGAGRARGRRDPLHGSGRRRRRSGRRLGRRLRRRSRSSPRCSVASSGAPAP